MGRFIVIEGLDNVGKTTTSLALVKLLNQNGEPCRYYKTPPEEYSETTKIMNSSAPTDAHYLYHSAMLMMAEVEIRELLRECTVVCDRWVHSTIAYHRAYGTRLVMNIEQLLLMPDLEILLCVNEEERMRRAQQKSHPGLYDLVSQVEDGRIALAGLYLGEMIPLHLDSTSLSLDEVVRAISLM